MESSGAVIAKWYLSFSERRGLASKLLVLPVQRGVRTTDLLIHSKDLI
jgi:hypothetical protein